MGLRTNNFFLGNLPKEKLLRIYRSTYVSLIPSLSEGLPNVLLEAMSTGLPVVATNVGGNPDVISSGINGFLVSPQEPLEMAKIVLKLIEDFKLRNEIGRKARKTIEDYFSWDKVTNKIIKQYYDII